MARMPDKQCTAHASYKKAPGILEISGSYLKWTAHGQKTPSVKVPLSEAASLFCSKEGASKVRLKLGLVNDEAGHDFTFTSAHAVAYAEREMFKQELTAIISQNRSSSSAPVRPSIPAAAPTPQASNGSSSKVARPTGSRSESVSSDIKPAAIIPGSDPTTEFRLRKRVLMSHPELGALHRELVASGQISEAEFWEGREHLLVSQTASENQKRGKPGQLVDPRPQQVEGGDIKIVITPQLVHDIFDEYPVVAKAYIENVPSKLSEGEFWKRYFQSKLFNAHRASIRSSATQHVVKDDAIFDRYLQKDDDELEPRDQRDEDVPLYVDLGATQEDHGAAPVANDITMQAGRQRGALPLIRKFNEHSERLLNSALGGLPPAKRQRTDIDRDLYAQIDLEDLHDPENSSGILLEMKDRERYFEGQSSATSPNDPQEPALDMVEILDETKSHLSHWQTHLAQLRIGHSGDDALKAMTQNVEARRQIDATKKAIPAPLLSQMTTCQTAANEFLRQFWSAIYPPAHEHQVVAIATPTQRAAKAAKMVSYLEKTGEKVDALVAAARADGIDESRVQMAMQPVLNAVDHALAFHQARKHPK